MEQGTQQHKVETLKQNKYNNGTFLGCGCIHPGVRYGKTTSKETLCYYLYDFMDSYEHKQAGCYCLSS